MKKSKFWLTWLFAVAAMSSVSFGGVVLYDGVNGDDFFNTAPAGFAFDDFSGQTTDTGNSLVVDTAVDFTGNNGLFGGLGRDLATPFDFDPEAAGSFFRIEYRILDNNVANNFRVVLSDIDSPTTAQDYQYFIDPNFATPLGDGFSEQFVSVAQANSIFDAPSFGFEATTDGVANFGLRQWQIQSEFGSTDRLNIEIRLAEIVTAEVVPEPGSATLALLGLVGLGLRRKRA